MPVPRDMTDEFVVRPYAVADRARVLELLRQVWPNRRPLEPHVDRRWWWQFPEPPLFVLEDRRTGALAGLCAWMPFALRCSGRERTAAWFVDFYVLPNHQGKGSGPRLTQAVQERFSLTASLSQTAMAWRVFQKLGWRERTRVPLAMHPWPKRWMFPARAGHTVTRGPVLPGLPMERAVDALWARVASAYPAIATRTSGHLLTRYADHGGRRYEIACGYRGAECVGYAITRLVDGRDARSASGRTTGLIVDVLTHPQDADAFAALLSESCRRLIDQGATRLYCLITPAPFRRVLARHGFLSPETPLLGRRLHSQDKWLTWFAADGAGVPGPVDWYVTLGDCDLDVAWSGG